MLDHRRRADGRVRNALAVSLMLHAAVVAFAVVAEGSAPRPPKTKVYAVDIVSPPPNVAGEPPREALSNQEPGPAAAAQPQPAAAQPAPAEPDPPAPDPEPAPPKNEAPKEPAKAPEPRRTPERPPQRPATTPVERPKQNTPPRTTPNRPTTTPATSTNRPATTPEKNRPATNRPASGTSGQSGTGSGTTRTRGDGTSTAPATGSNPQAGSPGGEGLNIHVEGDPCPVAGYCERVTIQVQRFFRAPPENAGARGEVCFRIQRDGSVTDIQAQRVRGGGAAFRLAMMEAAEAAGSRRAFGTLPAAFDPQRWRWCVELSPR
jgi:outer membrane biosynthesis protein TonB